MFPMHVAIVVLGDVGRSPRMQYHAKSLADLPGTHVSLIGYTGEPCVPCVEKHPCIKQKRFSPFVTSLPRAAICLYAPLKVLVLILRLALALLISAPVDVILVQNPPGIPALLVVWLIAMFSGAHLVIDWHNFGYTVLAQSIGKSHPFVRMSKAYENFFAIRADAHFCVTQAMRQWISETWNVNAVTLYDRAPDFFKATSIDVQHHLFQRLAPQLESARAAYEAVAGPCEPGGTLFTTASGEVKPNRPALVMSSTSWTEDEDFNLLLQAVVQLDDRVKDYPDFPFVIFIITGKGPLKSMYEAEIAKLVLRKTHICTMWVEPQDYPELLGSADLGVCLHTSTSGLDLPMKVVDMFGCQLPVCAVKYGCLPELVHHGENGMVFSFSHELAAQLHDLLRGCTTPTGNVALEKLRGGIARVDTWNRNWQCIAFPVFQKLQITPPSQMPSPTFRLFTALIIGFLTCSVCVGFASLVRLAFS